MRRLAVAVSCRWSRFNCVSGYDVYVARFEINCVQIKYTFLVNIDRIVNAMSHAVKKTAKTKVRLDRAF